MLRCAILRRVSKNPQSSCRRFFLYQQSLTGIFCHQKRSLGFLPIVSGDEPMVSNSQAGDAVESANMFGTDPLIESQSATGSPARTTVGEEGDVCISIVRQAKPSSPVLSESTNVPFSMTLPGDDIVSFPPRGVIYQDTLRIIQAFWEDFRATGPSDITQKAVLIFRS